ncbi:HutD/Ves family protein [Novosphingobium terrae]|uniref:HutD/Ves family protein n=1 Tax=Novosphingobium terrae TaxID=2726189 RepID=UPI001980762E|nr:HutD family protein [Novosphingobium terrae]
MSGFTLLRAADRCPQPWKNGGGITSDVLVHPPGADMESFDWRISLAEVGQQGPFSAFPGVDRILTVIEGTLELEIDGARCRIDHGSPPHPFSGDASAYGWPGDGLVRDVNVMVRRAAGRAAVAREAVAARAVLDVAPQTVLVVMALDALSASVAGEDLALQPLDALLMPEPGTLHLQAPGTARFLSVRLMAAETGKAS